MRLRGGRYPVHPKPSAGWGRRTVPRRCRRRSTIRTSCWSAGSPPGSWLSSRLFEASSRMWVGAPPPVVALAQDCRLGDLVGEKLTLPAKGGVNAQLRVPVLVAGMVAGADSIDDMDLLRHGGMDRLFAGIRAPSTLGTFLRTFTFGHVRQLDSVAAAFLTALAAAAPLLPGADEVALL